MVVRVNFRYDKDFISIYSSDAPFFIINIETLNVCLINTDDIVLSDLRLKKQLTFVKKIPLSFSHYLEVFCIEKMIGVALFDGIISIQNFRESEDF